MIIYNVTINIDDTVHNQWVQWMTEKHIPEMLQLGKFTTAKMVKVLIKEEMGGTTYSVQYTTESMEMLQRYYNEDAPKMSEEGLKLFADKMVAFRTELEVVKEFQPA